ncbi:MAG: hypothetical protein RQ733_12795 [Methyloprofundus sp.]|nr:hypothetical protein [Methyloprofundus sp.]MDT8426838.1 hypothetical protein [Methyloprofundus sp.]
MMKKIAVVFLLSLPSISFAQESIESVMARMKPAIAVQIAYQETRYMGLLDDDWQGSGYLYAQIPDVMLKQQLKPEVEIMAAEGSQLTYSKPATQTFHQLQIDESNPMMASLSAFKGMMTGNLVYLRQLYHLKFTTSALSWKLEMTAKEHEPNEAPMKIIMQGLNAQAANKMAVILPDGDRSSYELSQPQQGLAIKDKLTGLLRALKGN